MTLGDLAIVVGWPIVALIALYKLVTSTSVGPWWLPLFGVAVVVYCSFRHAAKHEIPKPFQGREPSPWRDPRSR